MKETTHKSVSKEATLLADEIAKGLIWRIQMGQYKAGQRLPVRVLCEEFHTSETPVKQALNQLMAMGLVDAIPKCGMVVHRYTFHDIKENLEVRLMIEQYCAQFAVELATRDEQYVAQVEQALEPVTKLDQACIEMFTQENYNLLTAPDYQFHHLLVESCRNSQIISLYERINSHNSMFVGFEGHSQESLMATIQEHRKIVDRLLYADVEGMKSAIREHIVRTIAIQRAAWKKRNLDFA